MQITIQNARRQRARVTTRFKAPLTNTVRNPTAEAVWGINLPKTTTRNTIYQLRKGVKQILILVDLHRSVQE